ncbi:ceramide-1-phosphate transfer protein-like [Echeneis naucrates]|uniref:ceramide-1-phosphate transfer protein-like n=1 Tax=Echeneis naucrates TaxID=173247 RepID=UPI001113E411|nr:ceramide-1-phosphate transfer protein-like [Echeneis naucrates]
MVHRRTSLLRYLLLAAMLALFLFISSFWLREYLNVFGLRYHQCRWILFLFQPEPPLSPEEWAWPDGVPPLLEECPGQSFQTWRLLQHLKSSLQVEGDVLLEPYLLSWDQLLKFMDSLGTMVSFFSQKVNQKVTLIRELSLKHRAETHGKRGPAADSSGLQNTVYHSVRSMVEAELKEGVVSFSWRTESGCRTLLRLHRSLLWLKLMLEGLSEGPDSDGHLRTPGELSRDAYRVALAPHHPWVLRQAAEMLFLALPDRQHFLQLVCVQNQSEATPILRIIIRALTLVHERTQRILAEHEMLELP